MDTERKYTTLSISKKMKAELDEVLYSSGKKQSYDQLLKELIMLKKSILEKNAKELLKRE